MQGKSTARQNLQFLGTPHLYHDQAKCILFSTSDFRYVAPSGKEPLSLVKKIMHYGIKADKKSKILSYYGLAMHQCLQTF